MKYQLLTCALLAGAIQSTAHASITPSDLALQKQDNGTAVSYVGQIDTTRRTIMVGNINYSIAPSVIVHDDKKIVPLGNVQKGSRILIQSEKKVGQWSSIKEIWILQTASRK